MSRPDGPPASVGHGTDSDEERAIPGGAQPIGEPRDQDSANAGRGLGLSATTVIGLLLITVPLLWAFTYLRQAATTGLGIGFTFVMGVVVLFCVGAGLVLIRGLFRT
jgi:hypothetical protein